MRSISSRSGADTIEPRTSGRNAHMSGFFGWLRSLFATHGSARVEPSREFAAAPAERGGALEPKPALPTARLATAAERHAHHEAVLHEREQELFDAISKQIAEKRFELPQLRSTSMAVIDVASKPSSEIADIVKLIASDPVLSSELLKTANSVLYGGHERTETISSAVVRIGIKNLRSLILSISMRGVVLHDKGLASYAGDVWRQSSAMAAIAKALGKPLGFDPERAFLIGLLADIGKVSLLAMLRRVVAKPSDLSPVLVGQVFNTFHEAAGAELARAWRLPDEIVSVAGRHHDYESNREHPRAAALASLAQRLCIQLSIDGVDESWKATRAPELDFLEVDESRRREILEAAFEAWNSNASATAGAR